VKSAVGIFLLGALVFVPLDRAAEKAPLRHDMMGVANGCFVESVAFLDHWHETFGAEAWAKMVQWGAKEDEEVVTGHAVAVAETRGKLWCWDINFGWTQLAVDGAQRENVEVVAAPILAKYPKVSARFPTYRNDFAQSPSASPPVAKAADANASVRDASVVGERLAKHRPVNVVRFTYPENGETKESAAAVFVFHGRYCVYVPEYGTVPFRIRGSVENLRLVLDALRRMKPGAIGVKKLEPRR
jgi:hypothetical protein